MKRRAAPPLRNLRLPAMAVALCFLAAAASMAQSPAALPDRALVGARFGYEQFRVNGNAAKRIDARGASWTLSNHGLRQNRYPFLIDGSRPGTQVAGGTVNGEVPLDLDWAEIYTNSAAVMARDAPGIELRGWTIRQVWDGIRIAGVSEGFLITEAAVHGTRDDAIENDHGNSGVISNSLFEGVFSGLSMTRKQMPDLAARVVMLDTVLMRMQAYPFRGGRTHGSPFKIEANSPSLRIRNTVLAVEDVHHIGQGRLAQAWQKTLSASNNYFLNLSDEPLPEGYPLPGEGWTVLQGPAARARWQAARAQWFAGPSSGTGRTARRP
ncbi:hypothetical protein [Leisingera sp. ANG59]|uniref:hypothetical protein n=1 Tax=Leisingera sp. ANG59 TaxID=2675221 RepID=UPI0015740850|nr:hypothetical protein [Leisingera sp. ANG59]NSY39558.1 hypothetical protein [Leisingera sp. ANG59]